MFRWLKVKPKYTLVDDGYGKFAIRRRDGKFFDLANPGYWWSTGDLLGSPFIRDCWGDEHKARMWFARIS